MTDEFPNNSSRAGQEAQPNVPSEVEKEIEKIISGEARVAKASGFRRFRRSFIAGDASSVGQHIIWNLALPAAQDAVADALSTFVDMMIYGGKRNRTNSFGGPISSIGGGGTTTRVNYSGISSGNPLALSPNQNYQQPEMPTPLDPTMITVSTRAEAEVVLNKMREYLGEYSVVTVAQLYRMLGRSPEYTDNKWGWTDLTNAEIQRKGGNVRLLLPQPEDIH